MLDLSTEMQLAVERQPSIVAAHYSNTIDISALHMNALNPVMAFPTIKVFISRVPS